MNPHRPKAVWAFSCVEFRPCFCSLSGLADLCVMCNFPLSMRRCVPHTGSTCLSQQVGLGMAVLVLAAFGCIYVFLCCFARLQSTVLTFRRSGCCPSQLCGDQVDAAEPACGTLWPIASVLCLRNAIVNPNTCVHMYMHQNGFRHLTMCCAGPAKSCQQGLVTLLCASDMLPPLCCICMSLDMP
jgi:hypothetical protein